MNSLVLYRIIYALAAANGREKALFGTCAPAAEEAFSRSCPTDDVPELWFELPLLGDPWFDLHALTNRDSVDPSTAFTSQTTGGYPEVFRWFAQAHGVRHLALSWDVSSGREEGPAIQLLQWNGDSDAACSFLEAAGRPDAVPSYRTFTNSMPGGWFACYAGVFPQRPGHNLRVECIPHRGLQRAYSEDADLIEEHLRQIGVSSGVREIAERCKLLAGMPFQFEFQFDVMPDGSAGPTLGASVRFASRPGEKGYDVFNPNGSAGELMRYVEDWGLADDRWRLLEGTMFAKRVTRGAESSLLYCIPTFVKLRWREGVPLDAKAYLIAGVS